MRLIARKYGMSEECIREEIARLQQKKDDTFHDFSTITPEDFMFVKCVNRRIRIPDGKAVYDGDGIRELYRSANIYVQLTLTKSFNKYKVLSTCKMEIKYTTRIHYNIGLVGTVIETKGVCDTPII